MTRFVRYDMPAPLVSSPSTRAPAAPGVTDPSEKASVRALRRSRTRTRHRAHTYDRERKNESITSEPEPAPTSEGLWRGLGRAEPDLDTVISDEIRAASLSIEQCLEPIRRSDSMLMFSDYGGVHKEAQFQVMSYLVTTQEGIAAFLRERERLRAGSLGTERRMAYKSLNDSVRVASLPAFLQACDHLAGVLINFAIDKAAVSRFGETRHSGTAIGELGPWAPKSFRKLTTIGHLAGILVQGLRSDGQSLLWITDDDEIAPNPVKHAEATRVLGHLLNCYCSGPMGHFRFGTTSSDPGDLHIEDLASAPDLAAGCLNDVLTFLAPHPKSQSVQRLFVPTTGGVAPKVRIVAEWLAGLPGTLAKVNIVVDERDGLCSVRRFSVVTDFPQL